MAETRIGVIGCAGRMGRMLVREIAATEGCALAGGVARPGQRSTGQDLGELGRARPHRHRRRRCPDRLLRGSDVAIEFTAPAATAAHAALAAELGTPLVIGTTGLELAEAERGARGGQHMRRSSGRPTPASASTCCWAGRASGARGSGRIGTSRSSRCTIAHKVDAPSGTALALGRAAAAARGVDLDEAAQRGRDGITGPRRAGAIGFAALRGGDNSRRSPRHLRRRGRAARAEPPRDQPRDLCRPGAVRAARWLVGRPPGLYGMKEVLGL